MFDVDAALPVRECALEGIARLKAFFRSLDLPVTMAQLGIERPDIDLLVKKVHKNKGATFGGYYPVTPEVSRAIYEIALG